MSLVAWNNGCARATTALRRVQLCAVVCNCTVGAMLSTASSFKISPKFGTEPCTLDHSVKKVAWFSKNCRGTAAQVHPLHRRILNRTQAMPGSQSIPRPADLALHRGDLEQLVLHELAQGNLTGVRGKGPPDLGVGLLCTAAMRPSFGRTSIRFIPDTLSRYAAPDAAVHI